MDLSQILSAVWQFALVVAVSFTVMCLLAGHIRFQNLARQAAAATEEGMDPHDAFQVAVAHALGAVHEAPEPFCVLFAAMHDWSSAEERHGADLRAEWMNLFEARIREALRSSDLVVPLPGGRVGILLHAPYRRAEAVCRRIVARVAESPFRGASGWVVPFSACIGGAAHPEHGERVGALLDRAAQALEQARTRGPGAVDLAEAPAEAAQEQEEPVDASHSGLVDPLTGLLRPDKVGPAVQKFVSRHRRQEKPVSLLLLDVDHLDRYNEHYGRETGDALLRGLGGVLHAAFREEDLVARLGGEEFLVVMGCAPDAALTVGQRAVGMVKKTAMSVTSGALRITLSGGVAGYPDHGGHPRLLLEYADLALAAAKERGRNMCLLYDSSMRESPPPARKTDRF